MNTPAAPVGAQAALRAIRLLKLFSNERPEMSLVELSRSAGLNKTTTHRLLQALQSESLVQKSPGSGRYSLGTGLMALGVQALASSDLRRRVRPALKSLARETGETATLEVPFEDSMLILDEVAGRHVVAAAGNVGTHWPLHATSTGKAYLAFDPQRFADIDGPWQGLATNTVVTKDALAAQLEVVRQRGYAETVDELEDGYTAVATVLRGPLGELAGTLSIGGPTPRLDATRRRELGRTLCAQAQRLTSDY